MIEQLYKLGLYKCQTMSINNSLNEVIEDPNAKGRYNTVVKIVLEEKEEDEIVYKEIDLEETDKKKNIRYLYKRGNSNGVNFTPTALVTEFPKTLDKKIIKCLRLIEENFSMHKDEKEYKQLKKIGEIVAQERERILAEIKELTEGKKDSFILTVTLLSGEKEKFPGDFVLYTNSLVLAVEEKYYHQNKIKSLGKNSQCFVCREKKNKVYGFCNTFKFYSVDKLGFVSGGFNQRNAWKNYPVCGQCASILEIGKRYLVERLSARLGGINYFLIPNIVLHTQEDMEEIDDIFSQFEGKIKISLAKEKRKRLSRVEKDLTEMMAEQENFFNFTLLFYEEKQSGNVFRILLSIEDVLPSQIQRIFKAKEESEKFNIFYDVLEYNPKEKKSEKKDLKMLLDDTIRSFFVNSKLEGNFDKNFLELINSIFTGRIIDYDFILKRILAKIRRKFAVESYIRADILKGFLLLIFLNKLEILSRLPKGSEKEIMEEGKKILQGKFDVFFVEHAEFFKSDYLKAVFLTGVLAQKLLNIQAAEKGSRPFYYRLNSLKLNQKLVKRIYVETIDKLNQYDKNYYLKLEQLIALYMLNTDKQLTDDEISFYFALGMNLTNLFRNEVEIKEE